MSRSTAVSSRELSCAYPSLARAQDAMLIRDAQRGSPSAFESLVRRYDQAILRLALRMTGSEHDAQDICQEAFLKAYRNIARFRFESSFYTWMHRIVTNLWMDQLRSRHSLHEVSTVITTPQGKQADLFEHLADKDIHNDPELQALGSELRRHIFIALRRLTVRERMVFQLKHFEGLKLRIIGEMLKTSEETAKNTLFRATHKLRVYLVHVKQTVAERSQTRRTGEMIWSR